MIPKDHADAVGDAIIEQARLATLGRRRRLPVRIPLLCRCRELDVLPRSLQADVVRQAGHELGRHWPFTFFLLGWTAVWAGAFWALTMFVRSMSGLVLPFIVVNWAVLHLLRGLFMRRRVRVMAARLHGQDRSLTLTKYS